MGKIPELYMCQSNAVCCGTKTYPALLLCLNSAIFWYSFRYIFFHLYILPNRPSILCIVLSSILFHLSPAIRLYGGSIRGILIHEVRMVSTVADRTWDPVLFDPGIRDGKKSGSRSGMNIPDYFSDSLKTVFRIKNIKKFWCESGSGIFLTLDPGLKN